MALNLALAQPLFWEGKADLEKRLFEKQEILVSVTNSTELAHFKGAGVIKTNPEKVFSLATSPEKIKALVSEIKELEWDPVKGPFKARVKILWFDREVQGTAKSRLAEKGLSSGIDFLVEKGLWFNVKGALEFRNHRESQTLAVIIGETFKDETLSWPVRVGLEAVLQRIAGTLRSELEKGSGH